jgi:glycosyltransferase involved in cell wall biosynthesis
MKTAILVANRGFALTSSRLPLMRHLMAHGYKVVVATSDDDHAERMRSEGIVVEPVTFHRGGFAARKDARAFRTLRRIFRRHRPDFIHQFHAKPVILGTLAARQVLGRDVRIVNTITGLGHAFIMGGAVRTLAGLGYRLALRRTDRTIFQNSDDMQLFIEEGWVREHEAVLVRSSGVDTEVFQPGDGPVDPPIVLLVGRMLRQKGVGEFVEAAGLIKARVPEARCVLGGEWDDIHPDALPREVVDRAVEAGHIEYIGYVSTLPELLPTISMFVLPSYREGVPRVVLESAACGVPTVGANVPGTREAIEDGVNGFLVPVREVQSLADRVVQLLEDRELRDKMGQAALERVRSEFDVRVVMQKYLAVYRALGQEVGGEALS